jgi:phosphatidylserine synthase
VDRKEVKRVKSRRKVVSPKRKKELARPWRQLVPYLFMGTVFVLGFLALLLVINGKLALAGRIILAAMIFAGIEYYYRQYSSGPSSIEHEFSAISDFFCFAVVPGFLMYQLAFRGWGILGLIGMFVIIFGALIRLSLYKLYNPITSKRGFIGIPLTISAAFTALVAQLILPEHIEPMHRLLLLASVTGLMFLTVSTIPYPNPTDRPVVFVLAAIMVLAIFFGPPIAMSSTLLLLAGGAAYLIIAPMSVKKGGRNHA